jgi:hypothetical protein
VQQAISQTHKLEELYILLKLKSGKNIEADK